MSEPISQLAARPAIALDPSPKERGRLKRRTFKLVLFLLLGAIINVAVACGCSRCALANSSAFVESAETDLAIVQSLRKHGVMQGMAEMVSAESAKSTARSSHQAVVLLGPLVFDQRRKHVIEIRIDEYGWPMRALRNDRWHEPKRPVFVTPYEPLMT